MKTQVQLIRRYKRFKEESVHDERHHFTSVILVKEVVSIFDAECDFLLDFK